MAKKANTAAAPAEQRPTAQTVWDAILDLPTEERIKLFERLAAHPENEQGKALLVLSAENQRLRDEAIRLHDELLEAHARLRSRSAAIEDNLLVAREELSKAHSTVVKTHEKVETYQRGPKERKRETQERDALIKQYVDAGMTDPKRILDTLRSNAPELAEVKIKTIQNRLCRLKQ